MYEHWNYIHFNFFNVCIKIVLNVSTINRKPLFCMTVNLFSNVFEIVLISLNACQTTNAYVIINFTMTIYTWRILKNDVFHVNCMIFVNASVCLINFFCIFSCEYFILIWCLFVNLKFWCSVLKQFCYLRYLCIFLCWIFSDFWQNEWIRIFAKQIRNRDVSFIFRIFCAIFQTFYYFFRCWCCMSKYWYYLRILWRLF